MSIRTRIAFLALVAILSVVAALHSLYQSIREDIDDLRAEKAVYVKAQSSSRLVHVLQKERGLSSAMLANPSVARRSELSKQYAESDAVLEQLQAQELHAKLRVVRQQVIGGKSSWRDVREFYTSNINDALDMISMSVMAERPSNISMHSAIVELALARESLGLMRATVNGIYSRGRDGLDDVTFLAAEYGKFKEHLRAFRRDLGPTGQKVAMDVLFASPYDSVIGQVEEILHQGSHANWSRSNALWWLEVTGVIEHFKSEEDGLYNSLFQSTDREITKKERELERYGLASIGLGLSVALLTVFTILHILRALGVLVSALDEVVRSQNYSIRILGLASWKDEFGRISLSLNNLLDFTDILIRDKERLASTDLLTGVLNRRSFLETAAHEGNRAARYDSPVVLLFIDIDHFKQINDTYGHAVGDEVLIDFVRALKKCLRDTDVLARWGGEEFIILAPETNSEQGYHLAEKLRAEVSGTPFPHVGKVTCSMGMAEWRSGETFDALCQRADAALYQAKEAGRNRVCKAD